MQLVVLANSPDDAASFGDFVMTKGRISPPPDMSLCSGSIFHEHEVVTLFLPMPSFSIVVPGSAPGCLTVNREKLSSTQAEPVQAIKSGVAYFPPFPVRHPGADHGTFSVD